MRLYIGSLLLFFSLKGNGILKISIFCNFLVFLSKKSPYLSRMRTKTKIWIVYSHSVLCTYWLSGRAGRENIWLEVMVVRTERSEVRAKWPRAKYFPVRPDLTQSISILSYDHFQAISFLFLDARKQLDSKFIWLATEWKKPFCSKLNHHNNTKQGFQLKRLKMFIWD